MTEIQEKPLLEARELSVVYRQGSRTLGALLDASLAVHANETVSLVGESGSGKSTLAMAMMRLRKTNEGQLLYRGSDILPKPERQLRDFRRDVQMVLQSPYASLDPRMSVGSIIGEGLRAYNIGTPASRREKVEGLLTAVGLPEDASSRRPAQFSGGQRQRIAIARALALDPSIVIADEPVSALDVSVQAQIINLLKDLQRQRGIGYIVVSHDLPLVQMISDRVVVLYLGRVVEMGSSDELVFNPQHPYTAALLSAAPTTDQTTHRERIVLKGSPPSPIRRPPGCEFHPRCPIARNICSTVAPPLTEVAPGRAYACHFPGELPGVVDLRPADKVPAR